MRLQNLIIIFVVIALPVIIILSVYVNYQVDTANLRASYDNKFLSATYDMLTAFQLNTTNDKYSTTSDSLVRDIEASINTFSAAFAGSLGLTGMSKSDVMTYVPALLFTMYDGYYIYAPTAKVANESDKITYDHTLKPYVYYTDEYKNGNKKIIINYSLDNYVAVYYYDEDNNEYQSKAGYLEAITKNLNSNGIYIDGTWDDVNKTFTSINSIYYNRVEIDRDEILIKNVYSHKNPDGTTTNYYSIKADGTIENFNPIEKESIEASAYDYYKEAYEFTYWYNNEIINKFDNDTKNKLTISIDNLALPNVRFKF